MNGEGSGGGANGVSTPYKKHLQLTVACEGGGGGANSVETPYKTIFSSLLHMREVVVAWPVSKHRINHLRLGANGVEPP